MERGQITYDADTERVAMIEEARNLGPNGKEDVYKILYLFADNVHYKIDRDSQFCGYGPIPRNMRFHPFGINPNATFHRQVTAGLAPTTFEVNEFGTQTEARADGTSFTEWHHVTAKECMPVSRRVFERHADGSANLEESMFREYFNAVPGIVDPEVFIPPAGCKPFPTPPSPPPGPKPPTPAEHCYALMKRDCEAVRKDKTKCEACMKQNSAQLKAAGCNPSFEERFCASPPAVF